MQWIEQGMTWANENAVWIVVVAALAIVAARTTVGGSKMARRSRLAFIEDAFAYKAIDKVEDAVADQDLTREEANHLYKCLRRGFPHLRSIIPSPELLKEKISNRLGKHHEPNLPDKPVMKHMFDVPGVKLPAQRVVL